MSGTTPDQQAPREYQPELGQLWEHGDGPQPFETPDFVSVGLAQLAESIRIIQGDDDEDHVLTGRSGHGEFANPTFTMRAYCWCDGEDAGHEQGCPPNFVHHETGVTVDWYKHARRGCSIDRAVTGREWAAIFAACWSSLDVAAAVAGAAAGPSA